MDMENLEVGSAVLEILLKEADGTVEILNLAGNQIYAYREMSLEPLGMTFDDLCGNIAPEDVPRFRKAFADAVSRKKADGSATYHLVATDRHQLNAVRFSIYPHIDRQGGVDYLIYIKKAVRIADVDTFSQICETFIMLPYTILAFDDEGNVIDANERAKTVLSAKLSTDILALNLFDNGIFTDEQRQQIKQRQKFKYRRYRQVGGAKGILFSEDQIENFFITNNFYVPVFSDSGKLLLNLLLSRDVTEEEILKRENARYQKKLHILDRHFELTRVHLNPHDDLLTLQNNVGDTVVSHEHSVAVALERIHPEDRPKMAAYYQRTKQYVNETLEAEYRTKLPNADGWQYLSLLLIPNLGPNGEVTSYIGKMRNLTKDVAEKIRLQERIQEIQVLNDKYGISFWEYDVDSDMLISNNDASGCPLPSRFTVDDYIKTLHPDDVKIILRYRDEMRRGTYSLEPYVLRHRTADEEKYIYLQYTPACMRDSAGEIKRYIFITRDITTEREQLQELSRYSKHTHQINKSCDITIWSYNPYTHVFTNIDPYLDEYEPTMTDKDLLRYTHPSFMDAAKQFIDRSNALTAQRQQVHLSCSWANDLDYHYYNFLQIPFYDENGKLVEYGITRIDETEKERTDRMLRFSQKVGKVGSWTVDLATGKQIYTPQMLDLLELDADPEDFNIRDYVYADDLSMYDKLVSENTARAESFTFILRFETPATHRIKWMESRSNPVKNKHGKLVGYYGTLTDITDVHLARLKAEESDRLKTAFLANMSHEIRTPLNAIVGFSELLLTQDLDPEDREEFGKIIRSNNEQLLTLISDILDLSKLESNSVTFKKSEFDVEDMLKEMWTSYQPKFSELPIELVFKPKGKAITMLQDRQRLIEVLTNFVNNAIKYTDQGTVTLSYTEEASGVKFMVSDTGTGIPEDSVDKIFNRFEKLDSIRQGTGLGLSICKTIAEYMNAKIGVVSKLGEGSTFWFWVRLH